MKKFSIVLVGIGGTLIALMDFGLWEQPSGELRARLAQAPLRSVIEGSFGAKVFISGQANAGNWRWLHACNLRGLALSGEVHNAAGPFAWFARRVIYPHEVGYDDARKPCPSMYD